MSHFTKDGQKRHLSQSNEASNRCQGQILSFEISSTEQEVFTVSLLSILMILFKKVSNCHHLTFSF